MNLKLFKKIIKNLLKFTHIALSLVINGLLWLEDKLIIVRFKLDISKRSQSPISRGLGAIYRDINQDYIGDIYIAEYRKEKQ